MDLFVIGMESHVWSTYWGPRVVRITLRAIDDGGRFIEVTGDGFTGNRSVKVGYDITNGGEPATDQIGEDTLTSDAAGHFVDRIQVNLAGDISSVQAQATDVESGATTSASI